MKSSLSRIENTLTFGMDDAEGATVHEGAAFTAEGIYPFQLHRRSQFGRALSERENLSLAAGPGPLDAQAGTEVEGQAGIADGGDVPAVGKILRLGVYV